MAIQHLFGVSYNPSQKELPWRARIYACGRLFHLANCSTRENAARAYDNAAWFLMKAGVRKRPLNFPAEYEGVVEPKCFRATREMLAVLEADSSAAASDPQLATSDDRPAPCDDSQATGTSAASQPCV